MTERESKPHSIIHGVRASLAALFLVPGCWHAATPLHIQQALQPPRPFEQIGAPETPHLGAVRSGFTDHLTDIADFTTVHNRQADLRAWKRRVDFLARQPGITDLRVDMPAPQIATLAGARLVWNKTVIGEYGQAFDYAHENHLNIILVAMPPFKSAYTNDARYQSVIFSYYQEIGVFADNHHIIDIDLNELGVHDPATGHPVTRFTTAYVARAVTLVSAASRAVKRSLPRATIIVSESAAMTAEATRRLLAVFSGLKEAGVPFVQGLNIYAEGPVEIGEIGQLVASVNQGGDVWVTEFGWSSLGGHGETMQAERIGEIFAAILQAGVTCVIGYEEMDEPRLQRSDAVPVAQKDYGIIWRADWSMKPAAAVFLSMARDGRGRRAGT